jgi:hypothetical protein
MVARVRKTKQTCCIALGHDIGSAASLNRPVYLLRSVREINVWKKERTEKASVTVTVYLHFVYSQSHTGPFALLFHDTTDIRHMTFTSP